MYKLVTSTSVAQAQAEKTMSDLDFHTYLKTLNLLQHRDHLNNTLSLLASSSIKGSSCSGGDASEGYEEEPEVETGGKANKGDLNPLGDEDALKSEETGRKGKEGSRANFESASDKREEEGGGFDKEGSDTIE